MKSLTQFLEAQKFLVKGHTKNQNEYVDLDLPSGLKWATCNIGADKPEDDGLLFQFGRVDGYKYGDKNHKFLSKDDYVTTSGTKYKKGETLKPEDDAAYQATKGRFRMPTIDEINELLENTDTEWTKLNGAVGRKFISKKDESKWIFIPAAGFYHGYQNKFHNSDSDGFVWSSFVCTYNLSCADCIWLNDNDCCGHNGNCDHAHSVRGVRK